MHRPVHRILGRARATVLSAALLTGVALSATALWAGPASATTATTTTVTSSLNPSGLGQSVTFTATVTPTDGLGTVEFKNGLVDITGCAAQALTLVGASYQATCTTSSLPLGLNSITAIYSGDVLYAGSTSTALSQNVLTVTTTTLHSSKNPINLGQSVTFTATVAPTDGGGTVEFKNGLVDITGCAAQALTLVGASYQATCTTTSLPPGFNHITAIYSGDTLYLGSTSAALTEHVAPTVTIVTTSKDPSYAGVPVTFVAVVHPTDGGGTVTFKDGGIDILGCIAEPLLHFGVLHYASCTTSSLPAGADSITAHYSGDAKWSESTSAPLIETILRAPTVLTTEISIDPLHLYTVFGTLDSFGNPLAGESLTFTAGLTTLCTATTNSTGTASCVLTLAESDAIRANGGRYIVTFAGTPDYAPSTADGATITRGG